MCFPAFFLEDGDLDFPSYIGLDNPGLVLDDEATQAAPMDIYTSSTRKFRFSQSSASTKSVMAFCFLALVSQYHIYFHVGKADSRIKFFDVHLPIMTLII